MTSTLPPPHSPQSAPSLPCAHCLSTWGAFPLASPVIHAHDRRVFSRGTELCLTCTTGCVTPGGWSDASPLQRGLTPEKEVR